jgi:hypothetical protein
MNRGKSVLAILVLICSCCTQGCEFEKKVSASDLQMNLHWPPEDAEPKTFFSFTRSGAFLARTHGVKETGGSKNIDGVEYQIYKIYKPGLAEEIIVKVRATMIRADSGKKMDVHIENTLPLVVLWGPNLQCFAVQASPAEILEKPYLLAPGNHHLEVRPRQPPEAACP